MDEFNEMNYNGDGVIDFDEFCEYCIRKSIYEMKTNVREANRIM